jgi:hypothetical protein
MNFLVDIIIWVAGIYSIIIVLFIGYGALQSVFKGEKK